MRTRFTTFIFLLLIVSALTSCKKNHYKVNTASVKVKVEIKRLEKDLFTVNPNELITKVPLLKQKYNVVLQFFSSVIKTGDINDKSFGDQLVSFCTDKQNNDAYAETMKVYPDVVE